MKIKTFSGSTMAEALGLVKRQFGKHAVILSTRTISKGSFLGLGGSPHVEITAARGMADLPESMRRNAVRPSAQRSRRSSREDSTRMPARPIDPLERIRSPERVDAMRTDASPTSNDTGRSPAEILTEIGSVKTLVAELVQESRRLRIGDTPEALYETYQALISSAVTEQMAQGLIAQVRHDLTEDQLSQPAVVRAKLATVLERMVPTAGPIRASTTGDTPTIITLVGATGVGKTTTIAKLAANFCLREKLRVGLVTIDTYRIAAIEQLKTYADIINVPVEVASSPSEYKQAIDRLSDRDIILVDTAGRSQRDAIKVNELKEFFSVCKPDEIHLVLSSTSSESVLTQTVERFREIGVDRVIFTKLDEAIGFGVMLTCLEKAKASLSYVTNGQDVPDDIRIGESKTLAKLILAGANSVS